MSSDNRGSVPSQRRTFIRAVGGSAVAVGLAGCLDSLSGGDSMGGQTDEVTIGSNHPLSGFLAGTGTRMSNAVKLAATLKNEDGGIDSLGGAEVNVIEGDDEGTQELGGQVQQQLIDDGAVAIVGCYSSPVTRAAIQVSERQRIPHVVSIASADNVVEDSMNYAYRTHASSRGTAQYYADWVPKLIRDAGREINTAGLIYVNNSFGQAIGGHLKNFLPERDIEVVEDVNFQLGASSLSTQVTKLREADPDAVCATTYAAGGTQLAQTMQNQDYRPTYMTQCLSAAFSDQDTVDQMSDFAEGVFGTNSSLDNTKDRTAEVGSRFEDEYDGRFDPLVGMSFTAAECIIKAIEATGSTDPEEINQALKELHYEDPVVALPALNFNEETGENRYAISPVQQVQDGTIEVAYPEEFATVEPDVCLNQC